MRRARRFVPLIPLAGLLILLALVFQRELVAYVILPLATLLWLLLRILVLSIDQAVYWGALLLAIALAAFVRLARGLGRAEPEPMLHGNPALDRVSQWQDTIRWSIRDPGEIETLRQELARLVTSLYMTSSHGAVRFQVADALKQRQIPLPEPVYDLLFAEKPPAPWAAFREHPVRSAALILRSIGRAPAKLIRRWSGREAAEICRAIDVALATMESSLEMRHDESDTRDR